MTDIWQLYMKVSGDYASIVSERIEPFVDALSLFEIKGTYLWEIQGVINRRPDFDAIKRTVCNASKELGFEPFEYSLEILPERDWVSENRVSFPALKYGRFLIHGSHNRPIKPNNTLNIELEAGRAFGSGTHNSTEGCLRAILRLNRIIEPKRLLDLGCGSGILSIAAARLWGNAAITALDVDSEAVETTRENAKFNGVIRRVSCGLSNGYPKAEPEPSKRFDVILANILARPLVELAPRTGRWLKRGGYIVLSGLLTSQEREVMRRYNSFGFNIVERYRLTEWSTLILRYKSV